MLGRSGFGEAWSVSDATAPGRPPRHSVPAETELSISSTLGPQFFRHFWQNTPALLRGMGRAHSSIGRTSAPWPRCMAKGLGMIGGGMAVRLIRPAMPRHDAPLPPADPRSQFRPFGARVKLRGEHVEAKTPGEPRCRGPGSPASGREKHQPQFRLVGCGQSDRAPSGRHAHLPSETISIFCDTLSRSIRPISATMLFSPSTSPICSTP